MPRLPVTRVPPAKKPPKPRPLSGAALKSHQTKTCAAPPAEPGNLRAVKHGAKTPKLVAPLREQHLKHLRVDFPALDHRRLTLLADRLARIDLASAWIEEQKSIALDRRGDVAQIIVLVDKWTSAAERVIEKAQAEGKQRPKFDLAMEMSNLGEAEDA